MSKFVNEEENKKYNCALCKSAAWKETKQLPCGHRVCGPCVPKLSEAQCPSGETGCVPVKRSDVTRDNTGRREMQELEVYCSFEGCETIAKLKDEHEKRCEFRPEKCKNAGCNERTIAREMGNHEKTCGFRESECAHCSNKMAEINMKNHLEYDCGSVMRTCVECGDDRGMTLSEMEVHLKTDCEKAIVECGIAGC